MSVDLYITDFLTAPGDVPGKPPSLPDSGREAVALLYEPDDCVIARVTAEGFSTPKGPPDFEAAYEMLVFCPAWEFRWVRDGAVGHARVVAETALGIKGEKKTTACQKRSVSYLLWGEQLEVADGWVTLSAARIGAITVPIKKGEVASRYALQAFEYAFKDDEHGNVTFGLQRCAAIVPLPENKPGDGDARRSGGADE